MLLSWLCFSPNGPIFPSTPYVKYKPTLINICSLTQLSYMHGWTLRASASSIYPNLTIPVIIQSPVRLMMVIILRCWGTLCITAETATGAPFSQHPPFPLLDQTNRDRLSTGFLIYGPLYKKGLGTQHSLSDDIESRLPRMEMWVVRYCVRAYLHCAVKLSAVTTACLPTLALKFIFACGAVWFKHVRNVNRGKAQWRQIACTLTGLCVCLLLQCTSLNISKYIYRENVNSYLLGAVCATVLWGDACFALVWISPAKNKAPAATQHTVHSDQIIWTHAAHPSLLLGRCIHQWWKLKYFQAVCNLNKKSDRLTVQIQAHCLFEERFSLFAQRPCLFCCFWLHCALALLFFWLRPIPPRGRFDKEKSAR